VMAESHPPILFYGARQTLRAALAGVADLERSLPVSHGIGSHDSVTHARQNELQADHEVEQALNAAREKLSAANSQSNEAMDAAW
jgi:hypothetical protein